MSDNASADRRYLLTARQLLTDIESELDDLSDELIALIDKHSTSNGIQQQDKVDSGAKELIAGFIEAYVALLLAANGDIADIKVDTERERIIPLLNRAGLPDLAREFRIDTNNYGQDVQKRLLARKWTPDSKTLNDVIKSVQDGSTLTVRNIVANGVRQGKSVDQIAKDIQAYVKPLKLGEHTKPYDEYRKRFGRPRSYVPRNVPQGSIQFNARLIARSESAKTYRQASLDFYDGKSYIEGWKWLLSNAHPKPDECDDFARRTYKSAGDIPSSHAQCMCDIIPIVMSLSKMRQLAKQPAVA